MTEDGQRPRRRGRRRRGGRRADAPAAAAPRREEGSRAESKPKPRALDWQWLTFPVFVAFFAGGFLILLIAPETNTPGYTFLFFLFLGGVAYSILHFATRWLLSRRRR